MQETWKPIPNANNYMVSDHGRVKNIKRNVILTGTIARNGYRYVGLTANGKVKIITVHSLVMRAFVGDRPKNLQVCHSDGDRLNNKLPNLRYDTAKSNHADKIKHGTTGKGRPGNGCTSTVGRNAGSANGKAILSEDEVAEIRATPKVRGSGRRLAAKFNVDETTISHLRAGRGWAALAA